jgi:DNA repair protein RadC
MEGHRTRLRAIFAESDKTDLTEEILLELLLTYAIPRKDVQPLAKELLKKFGSLNLLLKAEIEDLAAVDGVGKQTAILLKLVERIQNAIPLEVEEKRADILASAKPQIELPLRSVIKEPLPESKEPKEPLEKAPEPQKPAIAPLFANAELKEAIQLLPDLPEGLSSISEARQFFRDRLHYSAESTRKRNSAYIVRRMFHNGCIDPQLMLFAKKFGRTQALREVCFYRFLKAEPLAGKIIETLFIPNIGEGKVKRVAIKSYLQSLFPGSKSIKDCLKAFSTAISAAAMGKPKGTEIHFQYRDIPIAAFAFVLHSEYPVPGMFDIDEVEQNPAIRTMLWKPDHIVPALYKLRNMGIVSKISDIDQIRQVTTRLDLEGCVSKLNKDDFADESD